MKISKEDALTIIKFAAVVGQSPSFDYATLNDDLFALAERLEDDILKRTSKLSSSNLPFKSGVFEKDYSRNLPFKSGFFEKDYSRSYSYNDEDDIDDNIDDVNNEDDVDDVDDDDCSSLTDDGITSNVLPVSDWELLPAISVKTKNKMEFSYVDILAGQQHELRFVCHKKSNKPEAEIFIKLGNYIYDAKVISAALSNENSLYVYVVNESDKNSFITFEFDILDGQMSTRDITYIEDFFGEDEIYTSNDMMRKYK